MDSSAAGDALISDPGPEFDPGAPEPENDPAASIPPREEPQAPELLAVEWRESQVRSFLTLQGKALHGAAGKAETDWIYTELELDAISEPLTRILNRYPVTQAMAAQADELSVLLGLGGYTIRSIDERRRAIVRQTRPNATVRPSGEAPPAPAPAPPAGGPDASFLHTYETPDMGEEEAA